MDTRVANTLYVLLVHTICIVYVARNYTTTEEEAIYLPQTRSALRRVKLEVDHYEDQW